MKIDRKTRYDDFAPFFPYLKDGERDRLEKAAVEDIFGKDGFMAMPIGQLLDCMRGDFSSLLCGDGGTVFEVMRVEAFGKFVAKLIDILKGVTLPVTPQEMAMRRGVLDSTFEESVYVFCRSYFNLSDFGAVDGLKVADYVLAKRDDYNRGIVERNYSQSMKGGKR